MGHCTDDLIRYVCKDYGVDEEQLASSGRNRYTAEASRMVGTKDR